MELISDMATVSAPHSLSKDGKLLPNLYCIRETRSERIGKWMLINDYFYTNKRLYHVC